MKKILKIIIGLYLYYLKLKGKIKQKLLKKIIMKVGDFIKPVRNTGGHNYQMGKKYQLAYQNGGYWVARDPETGWQGNNIQESEMVLWAITKVDLEKIIKSLEFELDKNKKMIEFLTEEHKEELELSEFFAWHLVKIMDSNEPNKKERLSKVLNSITNNINVDILSQH